MRKEGDAKRREKNVTKTKVEMELRSVHLRRIYGEDIKRRAQRKEELLSEININKEILHSISMNAIQDSVKNQFVMNEIRSQTRETSRSLSRRNETERLLSLSNQATESISKKK